MVKMDNIKVRKARKSDIKEVANLFKTESSKKPYNQKWTSKNASIFDGALNCSDEVVWKTQGYQLVYQDYSIHPVEGFYQVQGRHPM